MHILWFCILIPIALTVVLLSIEKLRKMTTWWEILIPFVVTIITVIICQWVAIGSAVNDKEYWGHMSYAIIHEEPLKYDGECSKQVACGQT